MDIEKILFENADKKYAEFQHKLIPNIDPKSIIGVRTPILRKLAKEVSKTESCEKFLNDLPHKYFDENQLHIFIVSEMKDFGKCLSETEKFLPYVDNWATCDQLSPKVFTKHHNELLPYIDTWITSDQPYTIRFAVGMLMGHFLDEDFDASHLEKVAKVKSDEYYVKMMAAWYFATAFAKQWDDTIKIVESRKLDAWVHNKTIQKACESYRITVEQKEYLKSLKKNLL